MSANGKEYELAIRISGMVDKNFNTSLVKANTKLAKFKASVSAINSDFSTLDKGFDSIMKTGKKCFSVIASAAGVAALAIGSATVAAASVGIEFESAFTGVKKTVEATEEEYAKLRQDILDMSKEIPSSASEIAGVMEIAGQLGIAKDSLKDFTRVMIDVGESTNLASEDAATYLAKFANITNMSNYDEMGISNYERLGSVIVDLGNNFATTEEEIVTMGTNIAATGDLVGLSQAQIMALATAMSATGIQAEKGGTAMSKLLKKIQLAVETNSESLADYASVANMTGEQFSKTFKDDAIVALSAFIDGLKDTERNGKSAVAVLDDMGLKEIRLSDVILRLANAEGIMSRSIDMANAAWEENSALQVEANKRYATTESKLKILRNTVQELGIVAYDELQGPFTKVLDSITEKVSDFTGYAKGANGISKWVENVVTALPTLQRKAKNTWKTVSPFFEGILGVGKWFLKNPQVIVGAIAGIGTALATYKIASSLVHIVNALMSLTAMNPVTLAVLGLAAAFGVLAGAIVSWKTHQKALVDKSLEKHFGNIALSMEEIQAVAEHIVGSDSLGGVKEALRAFEDLDGISATAEEAISEIEKMNWKISIGMELTPDEQEQYKTAIQKYVESAQEYALQSQYAVSLNLSAAFNEGDLESSNVVEKVNQFYADKYTELSDLGTKLNQTITDAFNDGLLDIKETEKIAEIQAQIAEIEESLATGEFDAQLSILEMEYGGANLTADSFKNLQTELASQVEETNKAYKEAYVKNYASIQAAYEAGEYLSVEEYQKALKDLNDEFMENVRSTNEKAASFQLNTIMEVYGDEINDMFEKYGNLSGESLYNAIMGDKDFKAARGGLYELLELMEPTMEGVEGVVREAKAAGKEIPLSTQKLLEQFAILQSISGNDPTKVLAIDNLPRLPGDQSIPSGEYAGLDLANKYFGIFGNVLGDIDAEVSTATAGVTADIIDNSAENVIRPKIEGIYSWSQETIDEYYSKGFETEANVSIKLNPVIKGIEDGVKAYNNSKNNTRNGYGTIWAEKGLPTVPWEDSNTPSVPKIEINQRADGGLATKPELTWFAEKGPEMAIPIDGSRNAVSLWEQTGRLLGMDSVLDGLSLDGGSMTTIEYSPTLQFYGDAPNKEDIEEALHLSQDEFDSLFDKYLKKHSRIAFG